MRTQFSWICAVALMGITVARKRPDNTDNGREGTVSCKGCQWIGAPYGAERTRTYKDCYHPDDKTGFPRPPPKSLLEPDWYPNYPVPVCAAVVVKMITEHDDIATVVIRTKAKLNIRRRPELSECKAGRGYQSLIEKTSRAGAYFYDNEKILEVINVCTCNWNWCASWYPEE